MKQGIKIAISALIILVSLFLLQRLLVPKYVDGVVEVDLQSCTTYGVETYEIQALLRELGVPYMALETDYAQGDCGQLSTRLGAFLERL